MGKSKLRGYSALTDGSFKEEQPMLDQTLPDKPYVAESVHVNRIFDSNAFSPNDFTPVCFAQ